MGLRGGVFGIVAFFFLGGSWLRNVVGGGVGDLGVRGCGWFLVFLWILLFGFVEESGYVLLVLDVL